MATPEQLLQSIHVIEHQLALIKQALAEMGIREEGKIGTFDGEAMILDNGKRYLVPANYASKSMLVPGDTVRMIEDPNGVEQPKYKQIAKVERLKATGLLTRKDGKFEVVCDQGSFKVLTAAVKHFEGEVGDQVVIQFAKNHTKGSWAALERVVKGTAVAPAPIMHVQVKEVAEQVIEPTQSQPAMSVSAAPEPPAAPEAPAAPVVETQPAPALTRPQAVSRPIEKSKDRPSNLSKSKPKAKSRPDRPFQARTDERPAARPEVPRPVQQPETNLTAAQGEIIIPTLADDDLS
jgi:hypothetical protein